MRLNPSSEALFEAAKVENSDSEVTSINPILPPEIPIKTANEQYQEFKRKEKEAIEHADILSLPNRGIFASYFAVGFAKFFIVTPLTYYMVYTLDATAGQQSVVVGLMNFAWALKMLCGFLSDSVPIGGLRRKPYLLIGWILYLLFNIILSLLVVPNITMVALFIFAQTWAFILSDVCTDAIIVDRSKDFENDTTRGTMQAAGYTVRFLGSIVGAVLGAVLYNKGDWGWGCPMWGIFLINGLIPLLCVLPFYNTLYESITDAPPNISEQVSAIWDMVQRKAIWQPNAFIFVYNMFYLTNPAWNSFLVEGLDFSNFDLGILSIGGAVLSYVGIVMYSKYLFASSWRWVYIWTTLVSAVFSCLQLILVLGINKKMGMSGDGYDLLFAMGAYGVVQFVIAVQFLPACRMYLVMCPVGAEGASYAMLTTVSNLAATVAYSIAAGFAGIWDVSNSTLKNHNYDGMWKLTVLCGAVQLFPLLFIGALPANNDEQEALQKNDSKSFAMGALFVLVNMASFFFIVGFTIYIIIVG